MTKRLQKGYVCDDDLGQNYGTPVIWNNTQHNSISDAAKANGYTIKAMRIRVERGYKNESDVQSDPRWRDNPQGGKKRPVTWNGRYYPSLTAAAAAIGISVTALLYRLERGYTADSQVQKRRKRK